MNDATDRVCFSARQGVALKLAGVRNRIDSNSVLSTSHEKTPNDYVVIYDLKMFQWKQEYMTVSHIWSMIIAPY